MTSHLTEDSVLELLGEKVTSKMKTYDWRDTDQEQERYYWRVSNGGFTVCVVLYTNRVYDGWTSFNIEQGIHIHLSDQELNKYYMPPLKAKLDLNSSCSRVTETVKKLVCKSIEKKRKAKELKKRKKKIVAEWAGVNDPNNF